MGQMKTTALRVLKLSASVADRFHPPARGVVVLLYHRIGGRTRVQVDLPRELFYRQMELLAGQGRVLSLEEALRLLAGPTPPARDPVVVTFDDGTADFVDAALPVLEGFGIPATLYVATDHVERGVPFPHDGVPLSWGALSDALSTGLVTVGSHTHTHALLDRLPVTGVAQELDRSVGIIGDRLGVAAADFAYPKGILGSASAEAAVRSRFRSAAVGGNRANLYGRTDAFRLARSPIQAADGLRWFLKKLDGGMALEDAFRRILNRRRYAGAAR